VLDYANALRGEAPGDALPTQIAIILQMNIGALINESNMKLLKQLTESLKIDGNNIEEIVNNLRAKLAKFEGREAEYEEEQKAVGAKIAALEAELSDCKSRSEIAANEEKNLVREVIGLGASIAETEAELQNEKNKKPTEAVLLSKRVLENELAETRNDLERKQDEIEQLRANQQLLLGNIQRAKSEAVGGASEEIQVLVERLYEKINIIRKAYKKSVKKLLKSLKEKGYTSKEIRSPTIPRATEKEDLEATLDAILKDIKSGELKEIIYEMPTISTMKSNLSALTRMHATLKPAAKGFRKPRETNSMVADLLKDFSN
jgi:chromosome segregation ATPase